MIKSIVARTGPRLKAAVRFSGLSVSQVRRINVQVPFQDDLTAADDDLFNLEDFQHYQESKDVIEKKAQLVTEPIQTPVQVLDDVVESQRPMAFVTKMSDPYLNLAIEDYIYNKMPLPDNELTNYNRLVFYVNSPCVVIGKNQNPWKEVNLPLLNSLHIPLLRRKSGGGTVVHDLGNVNYSFMTSRGNFDRFNFVRLIRDAVNKSGSSKFPLQVNERGDITTEEQPDGISYKISGSAYKIARGKSYHHGTMLLNSKLNILSQLLSRDDKTHGFVDAKASIPSVRAKVTNIEMANDKFIEVVTEAFKEQYGEVIELTEEEKQHNEMMGLDEFMDSSYKQCDVFVISEQSQLNPEIIKIADELKQWSWRFGNTPKFTHEFTNEKFGFKVKIFVDKNAVVDDFELEFVDPQLLPRQKIEESFDFLRQVIEEKRDAAVEHKLKYTGSDVAGFVTNDMISDWLGESIDGTS